MMTQPATRKSLLAWVIFASRCIAATMACRLRPMHLKLVSSKSAKLANHVRLFRSACSRQAPPRGQIGIPFTKDGFQYVEYFAVPGKIILPKRIILMRHGQSLGNADESVSWPTLLLLSLVLFAQVDISLHKPIWSLVLLLIFTALFAQAYVDIPDWRIPLTNVGKYQAQKTGYKIKESKKHSSYAWWGVCADWLMTAMISCGRWSTLLLHIAISPHKANPCTYDRFFWTKWNHWCPRRT